jgi:hypothetical protein
VALHEDLTAAEQALEELERAVSTLAGHFGDGLDIHRLREDVARVATDLQLLREATDGPGGQAHSPDPRAAAGSGGEYDPAFWADDDDFGAPSDSHNSRSH